MEDVKRQFKAFSIDSVIPLRDHYYYSFLKYCIESAKYRIWISLFIINVTREQDHELKVRDILKLLANKHELGLDVKVIIGDSPKTPGIREANEIARRFLQAKGIPVKKYKGAKTSTHSKYFIIDDDLIVLGSHNWTMYAFSKNKEDSVAIYSKDLNGELSYHFIVTWMD